MRKHNDKQTAETGKAVFEMPSIEILCVSDADIVTASGGLTDAGQGGGDEFDWGVYVVD